MFWSSLLKPNDVFQWSRQKLSREILYIMHILWHVGCEFDDQNLHYFTDLTWKRKYALHYETPNVPKLLFSKTWGEEHHVKWLLQYKLGGGGCLLSADLSLANARPYGTVVVSFPDSALLSSPVVLLPGLNTASTSQPGLQFQHHVELKCVLKRQAS